MRQMLIGLVGCLMMSSVAFADRPIESVGIDCNWGQLTMDAIANGSDPGGHASDPSGDGHGPGTVDEPRVGLANVLEPHNLQALCELLEDMMTESSSTDSEIETFSVSAGVECNWGQLTMDAIQNGSDPGGHASDPSGDGHGPGTGDEPRAGLANVVEPHNLQALCEFLASMQ